MVVGRRERDELAEAHLGDPLLAGALELGRVLHGARADDRALAAHEARHRVHGADGAGVGQRDRDAREVLGGQLAVARAPHDVLVGGDELAETHCLATLDRRDDELALAVLALQVDGQAQVGVGRRDDVRLAVELGEVPVHVGEALDRLHDRVTQQVGERDLAAAGALEVIVDDDAVVDHQLGRDGPHAGGRRHVQRSVHVLDDGRGGAAQHGDLVAFCGRRSRRFGLVGLSLGGGGGLRCEAAGVPLADGAGAGRRRGAAGAAGAGCGSAGRCRSVPRSRCVRGRFGGVVDEEFVPTRIDRRGILAELAVHLLDQPLVLSEW